MPLIKKRGRPAGREYLPNLEGAPSVYIKEREAKQRYWDKIKNRPDIKEYHKYYNRLYYLQNIETILPKSRENYYLQKNKPVKSMLSNLSQQLKNI